MKGHSNEMILRLTGCYRKSDFRLWHSEAKAIAVSVAEISLVCGRTEKNISLFFFLTVFKEILLSASVKYFIWLVFLNTSWMGVENINIRKITSGRRKNIMDFHFLYIKLNISFKMKKLKIDISVVLIKIKFNIFN